MAGVTQELTRVARRCGGGRGAGERRCLQECAAANPALPFPSLLRCRPRLPPHRAPRRLCYCRRLTAVSVAVAAAATAARARATASAVAPAAAPLPTHMATALAWCAAARASACVCRAWVWEAAGRGVCGVLDEAAGLLVAPHWPTPPARPPNTAAPCPGAEPRTRAHQAAQPPEATPCLPTPCQSPPPFPFPAHRFPQLLLTALPPRPLTPTPSPSRRPHCLPCAGVCGGGHSGGGAVEPGGVAQARRARHGGGPAALRGGGGQDGLARLRQGGQRQLGHLPQPLPGAGLEGEVCV